MMKLNSARMAWHDALYTRWDSSGLHVEQLGMLGCQVQTTERTTNARHAAHQAISGRVQAAIDTLPVHLKAFGNHMYSPMATVDDREEAEEALFRAAYIAVAQVSKMTAKKLARARYVAMAILYRYRRLHQGGQSEGVDPLPTPEVFRHHVSMVYGVTLASEQWTREWGGFIDACFAACNDLDKAALVPVSSVIKIMKLAA